MAGKNGHTRNYSTQYLRKTHLAHCINTEILHIQEILLSSPNKLNNKLKKAVLAQKYILKHLQLFITFTKKVPPIQTKPENREMSNSGNDNLHEQFTPSVNRTRHTPMEAVVLNILLTTIKWMVIPVGTWMPIRPQQ